jgi:hypothetical protein
MDAEKKIVEVGKEVEETEPEREKTVSVSKQSTISLFFLFSRQKIVRHWNRCPIHPMRNIGQFARKM